MTQRNIVYTVAFHISRVRNLPWWKDSHSAHTFDSLDSLTAFLEANLPVSHRTMDEIRHGDKTHRNGEIYKTLWYTVTKNSIQKYRKTD